MFTRPDELQKKGGPEERYSFLSKLKDEFTITKSLEAKQQILANLANFAYDPINYKFIKELKILDIFISELQLKQDELLCVYATGGLCNLCNVPEFANYIILQNGIPLLSEFLTHSNHDILLNVLTIFYYLGSDNQSRHLITTLPILTKVLSYSNKQDQDNSIQLDPRLSNLATIFLHDLCDARQIEAAKVKLRASRDDCYNIPLPSTSSENIQAQRTNISKDQRV